MLDVEEPLILSGEKGTESFTEEGSTFSSATQDQISRRHSD